MTTPVPVKHYTYISKSKVERYYNQFFVPEGGLESATVKVGVVEAGIKMSQTRPNSTLENRLSVVVQHIAKTCKRGSIANPHTLIHTTANLLCGHWRKNILMWFARTERVDIFMYGAMANTVENPAAHTLRETIFTGMPGFFNLSNEVRRDWENAVYTNTPITDIDVVTELSAQCKLMARFEFLAQRIASLPTKSGRLTVVANPVYMAVSD